MSHHLVPPAGQAFLPLPRFATPTQVSPMATFGGLDPSYIPPVNPVVTPTSSADAACALPPVVRTIEDYTAWGVAHPSCPALYIPPQAPPSGGRVWPWVAAAGVAAGLIVFAKTRKKTSKKTAGAV